MSHALPQDHRIAALVPAYQEEDSIYEVVSRSMPHVDTVLVVNDGSTDNTLAEAERAGAKIVSHPKNLGKGRAIQTGFKVLSEAGFYHVLILDGDLQHLPEEIPRFTEQIRRFDSAMIVGCRSNEDGKMPFVRKCTNQFMSGLISLVCGQKIPDSQCAFRSMRSDVVDLIRRKCRTTGYDFESEMLLVASLHGHAITSVPITTVYGNEVSKIRPVPDTIRFIRLMVHYILFGKSLLRDDGKSSPSGDAPIS